MWVRHCKQDFGITGFWRCSPIVYLRVHHVLYIFPSRMVSELSQSKAWDWPGSGKVLGRVSRGFQQGSKLILGRFEKVPGQCRMNGHWSRASLPKNIKVWEATRKVLSFGGRFQQRNPLGLGERKVPNKVAGRFRKVLVRVDNRRNAQWILSSTDCSRFSGYYINVYS